MHIDDASIWCLYFLNNCIESDLPHNMYCFQCMANLVPHRTPTAIECCDNEDECNKGVVPIYTERSTTQRPGISWFHSLIARSFQLQLFIDQLFCFCSICEELSFLFYLLLYDLKFSLDCSKKQTAFLFDTCQHLSTLNCSFFFMLLFQTMSQRSIQVMRIWHI